MSSGPAEVGEPKASQRTLLDYDNVFERSSETEFIGRVSSTVIWIVYRKCMRRPKREERRAKNLAGVDIADGRLSGTQRSRAGI